MQNQTVETGPTELVTVQKDSVLAIYSSSDGLNPLIEQAREVVAAFAHDMSTDASRKKTASLARKVASLKAKLDGYGKDLVSDWKTSAKLVDNNRKHMRDTLDVLKEEARQPLTDWEDAEIKRVTDITQKIERIVNAAEQYRILDGNPSLAKMQATKNRLKEVDEARIESGFPGFEQKARDARDNSIAQLIKMIAAEEKRLVDEAELQRLKAAEEERQKIEDQKQCKAHEREIAKNARAKAVADKKAAEEREQEANMRAKELERLAGIAKEEAKVAAKQAEERRVADLERAEKDKIAAIEQARTEQIDRQKKEQAIADNARAQETIARLADESHVKSVELDVLNCLLMRMGLSKDTAQELIVKIKKGDIKHVQINY